MKPIKYVLAALAVSMLIATPAALAVPLSNKVRFGDYIPGYTDMNRTFTLYSPNGDSSLTEIYYGVTSKWNQPRYLAISPRRLPHDGVWRLGFVAPL